MSELRKILGTSVLSLFVVTWGLFMVCSGRVPEVNYDDYSMFEEEYGEETSDLMDQLAMLDDETSNLEESHRREILATLGIDPNFANNSEEMVTEELFLDLEVQIAELEKMSQKKSATLDSLKLELEETDLQLAALGTVVSPPALQFASTQAIHLIAKTMSKTNGHTNGQASNVHTNGSTNSKSNGSTNGKTHGSTNGYSPSSGGLTALYQEALDAVYARKYEDAITKFSGLLQSGDISDLADNSQYWIGECYFALGNYEQALAEFEKVFVFEKNNKADDAQFMMGMAYLKLGETLLAEIEFNGLLNFYEHSEYIARAERKLDDLNI